VAGTEQNDVQRALASLGASMPYRSFSDSRDATGPLGRSEANAATAAAFPLLAAALPHVVVPDRPESVPESLPQNPVLDIPQTIPRAAIAERVRWPAQPPSFNAPPQPRPEPIPLWSPSKPTAQPTTPPPRAGTRSLSDMFRLLRGNRAATAGRSGTLSDS
jgi:hypothetical protein